MSAIPAWAVRGAKVVCIDANWQSIPPAHPLTDQAIYTVTDVVREARGGWHNVEVWLYLDEVANPIEPTWGFGIDRFRPVVSTKTEAEDVAEFRKLLTQPVPEDA